MTATGGRTLRNIILSAVVAFLALGGVQEWETFAQQWFHRAKPAIELSKAERDAIADTVVNYLKLLSHFYGTGGDQRFADRIPASKALLEEAVLDASYIRHNRRTQEMSLLRVEILAVDGLAADRAEVSTREFWLTRYYASGSGTSEETRSDIVPARYRLAREGQSWTVTAWDPQATP